MPAKHFKPGDHVRWNTPQGETDGKVTKTVVSTEKVRGHTAKATPREPEYRVRTAKSGKEAIHRPKELRKI